MLYIYKYLYRVTDALLYIINIIIINIIIIIIITQPVDFFFQLHVYSMEFPCRKKKRVSFSIFFFRFTSCVFMPDFCR